MARNRRPRLPTGRTGCALLRFLEQLRQRLERLRLLLELLRQQLVLPVLLQRLPLEPWRVQVKHIVRGLEGLDLAADPILREGDEICFVGSAADTLHAAQALNGEV